MGTGKLIWSCHTVIIMPWKVLPDLARLLKNSARVIASARAPATADSQHSGWFKSSTQQNVPTTPPVTPQKVQAVQPYRSRSRILKVIPHHMTAITKTSPRGAR